MNSLTIRSIENDVITITDERLLSLTWNDAITSNDSFDIGSVIVNQLSFEIVNFDGLYDDFEFYQANVVFTHDSQLICTTVIDKCVNNNGVLDITAFDYLSKADVEFDELQVTLPTNAAALMTEVCRQCGLTLLTRSFSNGTYPITRFKDNVKYSCRAVMGYIAQIAGCWVKADANGRIVLDWYDKTGQPVKAITNVSDTDVFGYDITITGLSVKASGITSDYGETVTAGTDVYMLKITDNPLIVENTAQDVLNGIKDKIIGLTFRPLSCAYISDWTLKPGQKVTVTARGNTYTCYVNSIDNKVIGSGNISCEAARPSKMKMESQTAKTEAIARDITERHLSVYNLAMNNFTDLMSSALGLYHTEIIEQNGSTTHYWHNEEDLEDSQIQYKFSVDGFGVSHDYGQTWIAGIDAQGNILATVLTAIGVEASWVKVSDDVTLVAELNNLQDQIDNNIQTYSGTAVPTTSNYPANTWSEFDSHIGDLYYISSGTKQGYCYRFMKNGNVYGWTLIKDTDLTTVLNALTVNGQIAQLVDYSTTTQMQGYVDTSISGLSSVYSTKTEVNAQLSSVERENLTPYPYSNVTGRVHLGITYTVNADGSITANGTATGLSSFYIRARGTEPYWYLKEGTYELSGCPSGGSLTTYCLALQGLSSEGTGTENLALDYGSGRTCTIDSAKASRPKQMVIHIYNGTTVNNLTFYPMLEKGTIAHEYVPSVSTPTNTYNSLVENVSRIDQTATGISTRVSATEQQIITTNQNLATTNQNLAENVSRIDQTSSQISTRVTATEQQVITASYRNLISYPYYNANSHTYNGITYTVNADGSVTANGTATANSSFIFKTRSRSDWFLGQGSYIVSGCPSGGASNKYCMVITGSKADGTSETFAVDFGDGATFTIDSATSLRAKQAHIFIANGQTVNNLTFYPMLEEGSVAHKYEPTTQSNITLANGDNTSTTYENLITYPYLRASGYTHRGVTFTVNSDGSVTAVGTPTASTPAFELTDRNVFILPKGTYTLHPHSSNGNIGISIYFYDKTDKTAQYTGGGSGIIQASTSTYVWTTQDGGGSGIVGGFNVPKTFTINDDAYCYVHVRTAYQADPTLSINGTVYPMLERGMTAHSYQPTPTSQSSVGNRMTTAESSIIQNATDITAKVGKTGGTSSSFGWTLTDSQWTLQSNNETVLKANSSGLEVSGKVTASSGTIGGWTIGQVGNSKGLYSDYGNYRTFIQPVAPSSGGDTWVFSAQVKENNAYYGKFYVTAKGDVYNKGKFVSDTGGSFKSYGTADFYNGLNVFRGSGVYMTACELYLGYYKNSDGTYDYPTINMNGGNMRLWSAYATGGGTRYPTFTVDGGLNCGRGSSTSDGLYANCSGYFVYGVNTSSDRRLKKDIQDLTSELALTLLNNLNPQTFRFIEDDEENNKLKVGFIAQDVIKVLKDNNLDESLFVEEYKKPDTEERYYSLSYDDFIGILWKGWQEHEEKITEQENIIKEQQAKIDSLEQRLQAIENLLNDSDYALEEKLRKRGIEI